MSAFRILALDHITTFRRVLAKRGLPNMSDSEILAFKLSISDQAYDLVTGLIVDPWFGTAVKDKYPSLKTYLKVESGWQPWTAGSKWRATTLLDSIHDWIAKTQPDGLKLMIYYRPDAPPAVIGHQTEAAAAIGRISSELGLEYCLEPCSYPIQESTHESTESDRVEALERPRITVELAREFGRPEYKATVLKLDFPADLRYASGFESWPWFRNPPIYSTADIHEWCKQISGATSIPWTIMSSGASQSEFTQQLRIALRGGAAGYMCGQAVWAEALTMFENIETMARLADTTVRTSLADLNKEIGIVYPSKGRVRKLP